MVINVVLLAFREGLFAQASHMHYSRQYLLFGIGYEILVASAMSFMQSRKSKETRMHSGRTPHSIIERYDSQLSIRTNLILFDR